MSRGSSHTMCWVLELMVLNKKGEPVVNTNAKGGLPNGSLASSSSGPWPRYYLREGKSELVRRNPEELKNMDTVKKKCEVLKVDHIIQAAVPDWVDRQHKMTSNGEPRPWQSSFSRHGNLTLELTNSGKVELSFVNRKQTLYNVVVQTSAGELLPPSPKMELQSGSLIRLSNSDNNAIVVLLNKIAPPYRVCATSMSAKSKMEIKQLAAYCPCVEILRNWGRTPHTTPNIVMTGPDPQQLSAKMLRALVENIPIVEARWLMSLRADISRGFSVPERKNLANFLPSTHQMQQSASNASNYSMDARLSLVARSQANSQGFSFSSNSIYMPPEASAKVSFKTNEHLVTLFSGLTFLLTEPNVITLDPVLKSAGAKTEKLPNLNDPDFVNLAQHFLREEIFPRLDAGEKIIAVMMPDSKISEIDVVKDFLMGVPSIYSGEISTHILCSVPLSFSNALVCDALEEASKVRDKIRAAAEAPKQKNLNHVKIEASPERPRTTHPSIDLFDDDDDDDDDENNLTKNASVHGVIRKEDTKLSNDNTHSSMKSPSAERKLKTEHVATSSSQMHIGKRQLTRRNETGEAILKKSWQKVPSRSQGPSISSLLKSQKESQPHTSQANKRKRSTTPGSVCSSSEDNDSDVGHAGGPPTRRLKKEVVSSDSDRAFSKVLDKGLKHADDNVVEDSDDDDPFSNPKPKPKPLKKEHAPYVTSQVSASQVSDSSNLTSDKQRTGNLASIPSVIQNSMDETEPPHESSSLSKSQNVVTSTNGTYQQDSVNVSNTRNSSADYSTSLISIGSDGEEFRVRKGRTFFRKSRVKIAAKERPNAEDFILVRPTYL